MKRFALFSILAALALTLTFCSDDPVGSEEDEFGSVTFNLSGDLDAEMDGIAQFSLFTESTIEQWELSFFDTGQQTYSLTLFTQGENLERPSEGVYTIGNDLTAEDEFFGVFEDLEDGFDSMVEYSTSHEDAGGELVIEESSSDLVSGSFSFTAIKTDDETGEPVGEVIIENAEFSAIPTQ
ncbi:MAG: hypothetical protein JJU46_12475 [Balneolaceae bacterium]|nr:hypothetical protein [Balneolaceae bacterium]MCH8550231.1 hypothetical protein [Balneolaceae bacterium]